MSLQEGEALKWMNLLYLFFPTDDAKKLGIKNLNFQVLTLFRIFFIFMPLTVIWLRWAS